MIPCPADDSGMIVLQHIVIVFLKLSTMSNNTISFLFMRGRRGEVGRHFIA